VRQPFFPLLKPGNDVRRLTADDDHIGVAQPVFKQTTEQVLTDRLFDSFRRATSDRVFSFLRTNKDCCDFFIHGSCPVCSL
jgi:hypothetical protein